MPACDWRACDNAKSLFKMVSDGKDMHICIECLAEYLAKNSELVTN